MDDYETISPRRRAMELHDRALLIVKTDPQLAWKMMVSAVANDATFATGWYLLAHTAAEQRRIDAAIAYLRRALQCPDGDEMGDLDATLRHKTLLHLGHQLYRAGRLSEAEKITREAIEANPENGDAHLNLSILLSIAGKNDHAVREARRGVELSRSPITELGLAFALMFSGEYAEGLKVFQCRYPYKLHQFQRFPYPLWEGQDCDALLICSDQGMGDVLSFLRFIPPTLQKVRRVILSAHPELKRVIEGMFWHDPERVQFLPLPLTFVAADCWCGFMDLPVALGMTNEEIRDCPMPEFPKCVSNPSWKADGAKLHVGIAWAGNPENDIDCWRSLPLVDFLRLIEIPGIQLYSLQVGGRSADVHDLGLAGLIRDLVPHIRDVADTAAIMNELDAVVVVEGFHHHLAGTLGVRTHVLLSRTGGDWRCGRSGLKPLWYPNTSLHRERAEGFPGARNWVQAWAEIDYALRAMIAEKEPPDAEFV